MRKLVIGLAAAAATLVSGVAFSQSSTVRVGCEYGQMTLSRIASGDCLSRIPLPTPKPDRLAAVSSKGDRLTRADFDYVQSPGSDGETRMVRLVGPQFLPDDDGTFDLRRGVSIASDPLNAALFNVASLLGVGTAMAEEREEARAPETAPQLEARAELRVSSAHY